MLVMSSITFEKKQELLNQLLQQANEMDYISRDSDIQRLVQKAETIFPLTVQNYQEKIENFKGIHFYPFFRTTGDNGRSEVKSFEEGKRKALDFILGLIESNELIHSLGISSNPSSDTNTSTFSQQKHKNKVFIVHGHDDHLKNEVARFIESLDLEAVILHEQSDRGQTIISKFATHSDVGFAIVLYTPCDLGRASSIQEEKPRARQNVIFEHGYFVAKLGIENVVALKKGDVEIPNDLSGVIYKEYDESGAWKYKIANELEESGYKIQYKNIK